VTRCRVRPADPPGRRGDPGPRTPRGARSRKGLLAASGDRRKPAPDRTADARPRQPAAGRRPPLSPEHAETGCPLPRVTVTDDSVPLRSPLCRPTSAHLAPFRRRTPGRRPTERTTALPSTSRRLALVQRADPPGRRRRVRPARPATGAVMASGAGLRRREQLATTGTWSGRPRETATLDDVAWPGEDRRTGGRRNSSSATPAGRRALSRQTRRAPAPAIPDLLPPPAVLPRVDPRPPGRDAGTARARPARWKDPLRDRPRAPGSGPEGCPHGGPRNAESSGSVGGQDRGSSAQTNLAPPSTYQPCSVAISAMR
jgi:hypothetical protein